MWFRYLSTSLSNSKYPIVKEKRKSSTWGNGLSVENQDIKENFGDLLD
jgi:hypothetical protein